MLSFDSAGGSDFPIEKAKGVVFTITGNSDMSLQEVSEGSDKLNVVRSGAHHRHHLSDLHITSANAPLLHIGPCMHACSGIEASSMALTS